MQSDAIKRWGRLALVSSIFLVTTGGTFSSLGVLLPKMIGDIGWSWTQAGLGFTVLALFTGLSSTVPALTIKWFGIRVTYLIGGLLIAAGFFTFSVSNTLTVYLIGAGLIGFGYSQSGAVPAIRVISSWFTKGRSFMIGLFFTAGAVGSILGPLVASYYLSNIGSWRLYWVMIAVATVVLTILTVLLVSENKTNGSKLEVDENENKGTTENWEFREVLQTPQYYIITLAVTFTLFGALTMNTWQVTHMQNLGVAATMTAAALSAHAFFNALSRIASGLVIDRVGAKLMYGIGLMAGVIGMLALSIATSPALILIFAIGDGISFGVVTFATSIILLDYYGVKNNPIILGATNLVTTLAMTGPVLAGFVADRLGGFREVFIAISGMMLFAFVLTLFMKKPVRQNAVKNAIST